MNLEVLPPTRNVVGFPVTALPFHAQIELILNWADQRLSKIVCVANVHMLMEAHSNPVFGSILANADIVTPDGMPLVWLMKMMGDRAQNRVAGMDILIALCEQMPSRQISVFFLGSEPRILNRIREKLGRDFPNVQIVGMEPLPFRPMTLEEDAEVVQKINASGAGIVFVSLGCPKQEVWMNQHQGKVNAVMIGLGGAFPVYAGVHKWAPSWVRQTGFEWLYRLVQEPRRLWRRYLKTIPPFLYLASKQLLLFSFNRDVLSESK